ncbi:MAG: hypothetical protein HUU20_21185 [Pirellulales bacterium]|nr:hypothetical protein [Pirellulales bacterium]
MPPDADPLPFCINHIIAQKHHGPTEPFTLALACYNCNSFKGPNIAGIDPETGRLTRLFNPRVDVWSQPRKVHADCRLASPLADTCGAQSRSR